MTTIPSIDPGELAPVVDDLSIFTIAGRQKYVPGKGYEVSKGVFSPVTGVMQEAVDAERLGFRRLWLSERFNLKESGVVLGGAAALTSRLGLATGAMPTCARPPIVSASIGSTMQATYGPRFTLGLGRGHAGLYRGHGFTEGGMSSYRALIDYATIIRRLWAGETVTYDGPAGKVDDLKMYDIPAEAPEIWFIHIGGPFASKVAANPVFDGAMIGDLINPIGTKKSVDISRQECERIGRDPDSLRICQCVVTAPDLDDEETRELVHARIVGILEMEVFGEMYCDLNDWDPAVMTAVRNHPKFANKSQPTADMSFHRSDVVDVAALVPESYVEGAAGVGSSADCVKKVLEFREAGCDEVALYASTPAQNAGVISQYRSQTTGSEARV